ncbi:MAG: hypothetical protein K6D90_01780 [Lachnospiraceae bacterium]|nr:hypothetical protein [Lachnospiraceae bacterium]
MTYTLLPEILRGCLLAFATLIMILFICCIIRMLDAGRKNVQFVCTCVMAAIAFSLYQGMIMYQQEDLSAFDIPLPILIPALTVLFVYIVFTLHHFDMWQKTNISAMSVKEAFDKLPAGLAYYTLDGIPVMVNEAMQELSRSVLSGSVLNASVFWEKLKAYGDEDALADDNSVIIKAPDDRIYSIKRRMLQVNGVGLYELTAADISREYELTQELEEKQNKARILNNRLKALMETLEYVSMNRELLKLKTALHDNIGQSILIAKRYLSAPESVDRKQMLELWQDNIKHLINDEPEEWELPYYVISKEADLLGIRLNIIGELPKERELIPVVDAAVSTQVGNTLKHTNGTEVTIVVSDLNDHYVISLGNDGENPEKEIEPRGGLGNLREKIIEAGGSMEILYSPDFALRIMLPKGGDHAV